MSVLDTDVIDFGHEDEDKVTICISDHIPWDEDLFNAHLQVLQDKINAYLEFAASGQIYEIFGGKGKTPNIKAIFCYKPTDVAVNFLDKIKEVININGYEFEWIFRPIDE